MSGRFFADWQVGDRIEHPIRRTVTETDNLLFSCMTHNPQPLHLDAEAARASEFGQILVNGTYTFALMVGLSVGKPRSARSSPISAMTRWSCPRRCSSAIRSTPPAKWWNCAPPARARAPAS
jgi:acyl dehydratase